MATGRDKTISIQITTGTIVRVILFILLVGVLYYLKDLVLILLTALVIASAIEPATKWFGRYKIPRIPAVLIVYIIVVFVLFGLFYLFIPALLDEASSLFATLPEYVNSISINNPLTNTPLITPDTISGTGSMTGTTFSLGQLIAELRGAVSNISGGFLRTLNTIFGGVLSLILIVVFSFYFAVREEGIDDFLRIITPIGNEEKIINLWKRSQEKIGRWAQGQLVLALIIAILTYLGLTIFGVPYALLLALLAAVFELIPIFGPILAAIPAVIIAFVEGGLSLGLMVIGLYLIIQQFENHLIYPLVVKKVIGVPPLLVIIALLIGGQVAGFLGIILSVPIAAALQEFVNDIQKERTARAMRSQKTAKA